MEVLNRKSGCYRVRVSDTWDIARYFSGSNKWYCFGSSREYSSENFLEINETRIDANPFPIKIKNEYAHRLFDEVETKIDNMSDEEYELICKESEIKPIMSQKLYKEIVDGEVVTIEEHKRAIVMSTVEEATELEILEAVNFYNKHGRCNHHHLIYDQEGFMFALRVCGICNEHIGYI